MNVVKREGNKLLLLLLLLLVHFYDRCEMYTQALIERTMMKYPKYLVVHRSGAKSLSLSFVISIRNVSFHIIKIFVT